ncbi:MAG TPA: MltA domain-containing protein [Alphaproteobacteria bacterium]|nr:MltA domain-containing protein [Alphaproteobacteria bacterium]
MIGWGRRATRWALACIALAIVACETTPPPPKLVLTPARFEDLPGWSADRHGEGLAALQRSCARILNLPNYQQVGPAGFARPVAVWRAPCEQALRLDTSDHVAARAFLEGAFAPFAATDNEAPEGLFTGYYEPELRGSRAPGGRYRVPLHGKPADLVTVDLALFKPEWRGQRITGRLDNGTLKPYPTRAEIEAGALRDARSEIVWVDDAVDAFFLQVQGSGRILFEDGSMMRVGYAAQNGHPYVAIGRELIARGALTRETVSMQSIRAWLAANPAEAASVMNLNPSYVFFRPLDGDGPLGSEGVVLTPGRSLAVDRAFLAMGLPLWLDAEDPLDPALRLRQLVVAQDTGGAIRGPVRGDLFWGHGPEAAERAGRMRSRGRYWILLPRAEPTTVAGAQ